jgi:hypothetical protein
VAPRISHEQALQLIESWPLHVGQEAAAAAFQALSPREQLQLIDFLNST